MMAAGLDSSYRTYVHLAQGYLALPSVILCLRQCLFMHTLLADLCARAQRHPPSTLCTLRVLPRRTITNHTVAYRVAVSFRAAPLAAPAIVRSTVV